MYDIDTTEMVDLVAVHKARILGLVLKKGLMMSEVMLDLHPHLSNHVAPHSRPRQRKPVVRPSV